MINLREPLTRNRIRSERRCAVVHLYLGLVPQRADHLVAAGDDFLAVFDAAEHFYFGCTRNSSLHDTKFGFTISHNKNTLQFFLRSLLCCWIHGGPLAALVLLELTLLAYSERLNGNRQNMRPGGCDDLCRAGEARPREVPRNIERDHHSEILCFLTRSLALRCRHTTGANDSSVANLDHATFESPVGNCIDGYVRRLV